MQSGVEVANGKITGTLKFIEGGLAQSGPLAGDGYFLALKFLTKNIGGWDAYTSVKVALDPSASGMQPVEILTDPDKNGVFKIKDDLSQSFKVISTFEVDGDPVTKTDTYDLSELTLVE